MSLVVRPARSSDVRGIWEMLDPFVQRRILLGKDIVVLGSGDLLQTLMRSGLVDHFLLSIHPLVLGRGRRLFNDDDARRAYRLVRSLPTTTGVVIAGYEPA